MPAMRSVAIILALCGLLLAAAGCSTGTGGRAPTATPVAAPTPTPLPAPDLLARALAQRAIGADDSAAHDLSALLAAHPAAAEAVPARYYLAESYARRGRWASATALFDEYLALDPDPLLAERARFWLARGYESIGDHPAAIAAYADYLAAAGADAPLAVHATMRQAAQLQAVGRLAEAAAGYELAARSNIDRGERAVSYEQAIALHREQGRPDAALALYGELLDFAQVPAYRARILAEAVALASSNGALEQARAWQQELIATAPATPQAAAAVDQLLAAGDGQLAALTAAEVYMAAENYAAALAQYDAALLALPPEDPAALDLQHRRGLALRGLGRFTEALAALAAAGVAAPDTDSGRQAQLDWIQTLGQSGDVVRAITAYTEFAAAYPADPRAPEALDRAAQLHERLGDPAAAFAVRQELGQRFPQSEQGRAALHATGLALFQIGRYDEAGSAWQRLAAAVAGYEQARAAFWAGRAAQAAGADPTPHFEMAVAAAPGSYYAARAAEELGRSPTPQVAYAAPIGAEEWQALSDWIAGWAADPAAPGGPDADAVQRAVELAAVGLGGEAINEWNRLRQVYAGQPLALLGLAQQAYEQQTPYVALKIAEDLAALAPADVPPAPLALQRLIFPMPYPWLVRDQAAAYGLDPRLLYALIRQESLFNPDATSWVGARGLAQVMPATGAGIARRLAVADFQLDDLYRPAVSVRFGAFYLSERLKDMEGSIPGALAAYNGGLGNALRWAGGSTVADPDLFSEQIDFPETEGYVKAVYGFYNVYRDIYAAPAGE